MEIETQMSTHWVTRLVRCMRPFRPMFHSLLKSLPESTVFRILSGPLRGARWVFHSGVGGYWAGTYEAPQQRALMAMIKPGMVCYDCGANVGYYTLLFSKLVGPRGKVIAFEPLPRNVALLKRHIAMNGCSNVVIEEMALSNVDGMVRLNAAGPMSKIDSNGEVEVICRKIDSLNLTPPDLMKIDVEGAEIDMLAGAESAIRSYHPSLVVSLHLEPERAGTCAQSLESLGYDVTWLDRDQIIATYAGHEQRQS